jgi:hypothetical protein
VATKKLSFAFSASSSQPIPSRWHCPRCRVLLEQQIFRPTKTLFTSGLPCHQRLRKRIAKISSATELIKIPYQNTSKAKSSCIIFAAKKNLPRLFTRSNVTTIKSFVNQTAFGCSQTEASSSAFFTSVRQSYVQKAHRESCTKRAVVEDLQENVDDEAQQPPSTF